MRWAAATGEASSVSHAGWLVVSLLLVAAFLVWVLGPGQPWLRGITSGITQLKPPPNVST